VDGSGYKYRYQDVFNPDTSNGVMSNPFGSGADDDESAFGPFSEAVASGSDPFAFPTNFSEDLEDGSFDSFGDFGDFQTAQDGELTPPGSWTFTSSSSASDEAGSEDSHGADDSTTDRTETVVLEQKRTMTEGAGD